MICKATKSDLEEMVALSYQKRLAYEKVQPHFWKMAGNSNQIQKNWFSLEMLKGNVIALCYKINDKISGFIIGKLINPPEVYEAGPTLMIDDFCVKNENLWSKIGKDLLQEIIKQSKEKGAKQILVVCGNHDLPKKKLLDDFDLKIASNWLVKDI